MAQALAEKIDRAKSDRYIDSSLQSLQDEIAEIQQALAKALDSNWDDLDTAPPFEAAAAGKIASKLDEIAGALTMLNMAEPAKLVVHLKLAVLKLGDNPALADVKQRQAVFIRAFCRALKPGGILQFQALSHRHINTARDLLAVITPEPIKSTWRIITGKAHTDMEMHTFRQQEIVELLAQEPVDLLAHWPDHAAGPRFSSYTYVVRKRRAPPNAH